MFSYSKRILKRIVLIKPSAEAPSKLDDELVFDSFLFFWAGSRKLTFIHRYADSFDSFCANPLEERQFELIPGNPKIKRASFIQSVKDRMAS